MDTPSLVRRPLSILVAGGGPAGLLAALLLQKARPDWRVRVRERDRPGDTFGWGVVFSADTLDTLAGADPETVALLAPSLARWDAIDIQEPVGAHAPDQTPGGQARFIRSHGHDFSGVARAELLQALTRRALDLGVEITYGLIDADVDTLEASCDLLLAADGVHSRIRQHHADTFVPQIDLRPNRYIWLGTPHRFDAFTFLFERAPDALGGGWFQAHAYPYGPQGSTFIIETTERAWRDAGLEGDGTGGEGTGGDIAATLALGQTLFGRHLNGAPLLTRPHHDARGTTWVRFPRLSCARWVRGTIALLGDAAHTAHFSIGSGTKLAMEDAITLAAHVVEASDDLPGALARYEGERRTAVARVQAAARNSMEWFENVARYTRLPPPQFAYSLLTRSQRIGHANLAARDPAWLRGYERWLAGTAGIDATQPPLLPPPPPPMFLPFTLGDLTLRNRVVVAPMATYSAVDGTVGDFHLVHYGSRAQGGAGLLVTEMVAVAADARITPACAGLYTPAHTAAWKRVVDFVHAHTPAAFCLQLGHAGPKGATHVPWERHGAPLADGSGWPLVAASPQPWDEGHVPPAALDATGMERIIAQFVAAARAGLEAGFDMLELHAAHGYLLSSFLSPLSNRRRDAYGGTLENRARFPLAVLRALRAVWPAPKPLSVRISATDWQADGMTGEDSVALARMLADAGADLIDVSAGQTSPHAKPLYGRMFQTPYADRIRNETGIATMAVGAITDADQINGIIAAGRADLVALGRLHLADPYFTLHAAARQGVDVAWPAPYGPGRDQWRHLHAPPPAPHPGSAKGKP